MSKKDYFEDDGRPVADMSGIDRPSLFGLKREHGKDKHSENENAENGDKPWEQGYSKSERRAAALGALGAALLIAAVFAVGLGLVILLLVLFWNK